jgi:hypothetical protein
MARHWLLIVAIAMAAQWGGGADVGRSTPQSAATPVAVLYDGAVIEKAAAKEDRHRFEVSLSEGEFLELTVSQDLFLVSVSVLGPDDTGHGTSAME